MKSWWLALFLVSCVDTEDPSVGGSTGPGGKADDFTSCGIDVERSVWIRDLRVVDDPARTGPAGAWSLKQVVAGIAPPNLTPERLFSRTVQSIMDLCPYDDHFQPTFARLYGTHCDPDPPFAFGILHDLDEVPAKLIGIVNRVDLASPDAPSGELRLLYQVYPLDSSPALNQTVRRSNAPSAWHLNFEFDLAAVRDSAGAPIPREEWAARFVALGALPLGSPAYNAALEELTTLVTRPNAAPGRTNGSALRRLRISMPNWNWGNFSDGTWKIQSRELDPTGALVRGPLEKTPSNWWANPFTTPYEAGSTTSLVTWLVDHEASVLDGSFTLPAAGAGLRTVEEAEAFGGSGAYLSRLPFESANLPAGWSRERYDAVVNAFRAQTCDGCHGAQGTRGVHAFRRRDTEPAELSPFVEAQLPQRANALAALVCH
jgi:hypothetical protein